MQVRNEERFASDISAVARIPATGIETTILDVSSTGCKLAADSNLAQVGATIIIRLSERDEIAGQVVWANRKLRGVKFHSPISDELIDQIANGLDQVG